MVDHSFPANVRIKSRLDFDRAFRDGVVVADNILVLHVIRRKPHHAPSDIDSNASGTSDSNQSGDARLERTDSGDINPAPAFPPNCSRLARLGLSISKRVGNAPTRNRWKRLIREVFRKHRLGFPTIDIVARPKKGAVPSYDAILNSMPALVARAIRKLTKDQD